MSEVAKGLMFGAQIAIVTFLFWFAGYQSGATHSSDACWKAHEASFARLTKEASQ